MKSNFEIAKEVIDGKWGNGDARRISLQNAGYNYEAIQYLVNKIVSGEGVDVSTAPGLSNPNSTARLLNVEVDLTKYDGVTLIIVGADNA